MTVVEVPELPVRAPVPASRRVRLADSEAVRAEERVPSAAPYRPTPGRLVMAVGCLVALFVGYTVFGSAVSQHRAQTLLLRDFRAALQAQADDQSRVTTGGSGLIGSSGAPTGAGSQPQPPSARPRVGAPVALLQVPSVGISQVVVEGTTVAQLRDAPGHHRNTVMPGQPGNAAISGARVANGGPFLHLARASVGDRLVVTTLQGAFTYAVTRVHVLRSSDPDPLAPTADNRLTLLTSDSPGVANRLLAVEARLLTRPVAAPAGVRPVDAPASEGPLASDGSAWATTLLALLVFAGILVATRRAYTRWSPATAWLVSTPLLLVALFVLFRQAGGLLPATF